MKLMAVFLAVCGSLRNKTFACRETNELIKIGGQRHSVYIIVFNFIKLYYFRHAFLSFWCCLFWVRTRAFNNHFPDI